VLGEARHFLDEVAEEENGVLHAGDALGRPLPARLVFVQQGGGRSPGQSDRAVTAILARLVAQDACLRWP
jgi:hypothetical protein